MPLGNFLKGGVNSPLVGYHLAKEVLAEIPEQSIGFMKANGIVPKPPISNPTRIELPNLEMTLLALE